MGEKMKKTEEDDEDTQELIDGFEQIEKPKDNKQKSVENEEIKQQNSLKMEENEKETPNETDIAEMVRTENDKDFAPKCILTQSIIDEKQNQNDKNEEDELQNAESDSSSSSDSDSSLLSDSSSSDSIPSKHLKRRTSKNI